MKQSIKCSIFLVTVLSITSCYRAPDDNEWSTIPATNNRDYTREGQGKGSSSTPNLPGIGY